MSEEKQKQSDGSQWQPRIVAFLCNWCSYAGADLAGMSRRGYPAAIKVIRVPCSGRVDPMFVLKSFECGADMVLLAFRELLAFMGIDQRRFKISWVSAAEGAKWSSLVTDLTAQAQALGPFKTFATILQGEPS